MKHTKERGNTPAQLALGWVMAEERITCPILGARNLEPFRESLQGARIGLTEAERKEVPAARRGS